MSTAAIDLSHTPGINYALAYWISFVVYQLLLPQRTMAVWKRASVLLAGFLGLTSFMILTDGIDKVFFIPCMLLDAAMMVTLLHICCEGSWKKAAYFSARAFMLGEFAAAVEWQVYYFLLRNGILQLTLFQAWSFLALVYSIVFGTLFLLERRYAVGNAQLNVTTGQLLSILLLTVSVYTVSNLSYVNYNTPFSGSSASEIFIIRSLVDLGGVGILFAMHLQNLNLSFRMQADYLQKLLTMQYDNYRIHEESVRLVNQKYHDLKHQIMLLRSEISTEEKLAHLDVLEKDIRIYEAQNKTGNAVLDTILTARSLQCQQEGISLTCTADGSTLRFMNAMDLSILFGNALDNAIESVRKIDDREKRLIHLTINQQKNFIRIHMENCYEGQLQMVNGMPKTNKQDTDFHGFGLKSIQTIVEKYSGSMTLHAENGWFELRILFPMPDKRS